MQPCHDVHDRAINGVVVGQRSVHVIVANTAEISVPPFPGTTTVCAERDPVGARRVTHSPPEAVAVGVGAVHLVTAVQGNKNDTMQTSGKACGTTVTRSMRTSDIVADFQTTSKPLTYQDRAKLSC